MQLEEKQIEACEVYLIAAAIGDANREHLTTFRAMKAGLTRLQAEARVLNESNAELSKMVDDYLDRFNEQQQRIQELESTVRVATCRHKETTVLVPSGQQSCDSCRGIFCDGQWQVTSTESAVSQ